MTGNFIEFILIILLKYFESRDIRFAIAGFKGFCSPDDVRVIEIQVVDFKLVAIHKEGGFDAFSVFGEVVDEL